MNDLSEPDIKVFVDAILRFFRQLSDEGATVRSAYLADEQNLPPIYDYTGIIAVHGGFKGHIYFSASRTMLALLILSMGENLQEAHFLDMVGEVANTFSGNARQHFGSALDIAPPINIRGRPEVISSNTRARPYVVPFVWKGQEAVLVVDIERIAS